MNNGDYVYYTTTNFKLRRFVITKVVGSNLYLLDEQGVKLTSSKEPMRVYADLESQRQNVCQLLQVERSQDRLGRYWQWLDDYEKFGQAERDVKQIFDELIAEGKQNETR